MIELIAAAVMGAAVGGGVVWWQMQQAVDEMESAGAAAIDAMERYGDRAFHALTALRSNCFIPDERGVKVRYSEASVARRVKAETPKEVG